MLSGLLIGYTVVLSIDVLVGTGFIVWKCVLKKEETECELATIATLGSVGIWLLVLLVWPLFITRIDLCKYFVKLHEACYKTVEKFRPQTSRIIQIQSEIYLPTTLAFRGKGHLMIPCDQGKMAPHFNDTTRMATMSEMSDPSNHPDVVYTYSDVEGSLVRVPLLKYLDQQDYDEP